MAQSNGDVLAKDFENIILAWSSGISGEQREVLAPEAKELVQMLCSSAERVRKQYVLDAKTQTLTAIKESFSDLQNDEEAVYIESGVIDPWLAELKKEREELK